MYLSDDPQATSTRADFAAERELYGLSAADAAREVGIKNVKFVNRCERGREDDPLPSPGLWNLLSAYRSGWASSLDAMEVWVKQACLGESDEQHIAVLPYFHDQKDFEENCPDEIYPQDMEESYRVMNSRLRLVAERLRAQGYGVEFRFSNE